MLRIRIVAQALVLLPVLLPLSRALPVPLPTGLKEPLLETAYQMNGLCSLMALVSYLPYEGSNLPNNMSEEAFAAAKAAAKEQFWDKMNPDGAGVDAHELNELFTGPNSESVLEYVRQNRKDKSDKPLRGIARISSAIKKSLGLGSKKDTLDAESQAEFDRHMKTLGLFLKNNPESGSVAYYRVEDEALDQVVGVTVNHPLKRVTVVFRGSHNLEDWFTNLQFTKRRVFLGDPSIGVDIRKVKVHKGFWKRLSALDKDTDLYFFKDVIKPALKTEFEDKENFADGYDPQRVENWRKYSLYVAGHSLGGAQATYAGLLAALDPDIRTWFMGPVTVVSLAAPRVGDKAFRRLHQELEEKGVLRHLRIQNPDDVVPFVPPGIFGFQHVGLRLLLFPDAPTARRGVEYPDSESFFPYRRTGIFFKSPESHYSWIHTDRLQKALEESKKDSKLNMSLEEAFEKELPQSIVKRN